VVRDRHLVSGYTRDQLERWKLDPGQVRNVPAFVKADDFSRIAALCPHRIPDRTLSPLSAIYRRTSFFGEAVPIYLRTDYPLGFARNEREFHQLIRFASEEGWLKYDAASGALSLTLTAAGFDELEGRIRSNLESEQVFVARWFDVQMDDLYAAGIKPAVDESGYVSFPVNAREYNGDVVDQIMVEIRKSRFVVADTTGHRGGVYFEAGFALGLGLPVIFTCREGDFEKTHFDVNHMNHIVWKTPGDLRSQLARRIQATIGFGPLRQKSTAGGPSISAT
jgi:hypothetical protein